MKKFIFVSILMLLLAMPLWAIINDNLRLTQAHAIPTAYTLNKGEVLIGIGPLGYGLTDKLEVSTNMLLDILQVLNVGAKFNIIDNVVGIAGGVGYQHFGFGGVNYNAFIVSGNLSVPVNEKMKLHTGASYAYIPDFSIDEVDFSGGAENGTMIPLDVEYDINEHSAFLGGAAYDFTYEYFRIGASYLYSWEKFNLQLGGNYASASGWTYFLPTIGIWWRF